MLLYLSVKGAFDESDIEILRIVYNTYDTDTIINCFDSIYDNVHHKVTINDKMLEFICENTKAISTRVLENMIRHNEDIDRISKIILANDQHDDIVSLIWLTITGCCLSNYILYPGYNKELLNTVVRHYDDKLTINLLHEATGYIRLFDYEGEVLCDYDPYILSDIILYIFINILNTPKHEEVMYYDVKVLKYFVHSSIKNDNTIVLDKLLSLNDITFIKYQSSECKNSLIRHDKPDDYTSLFSEDIHSII